MYFNILLEGSQSQPVNFGDVIKNWCTQCDGCCDCYKISGDINNWLKVNKLILNYNKTHFCNLIRKIAGVGYCRIVQRDNRSTTHITIFINVRVGLQSRDDLMVVI